MTQLSLVGPSPDLDDMIGHLDRHGDDIVKWPQSLTDFMAVTESTDEIKLRKSVSVPTDTYGLIKKDLMWVKMSDWLASLAKSNRIVADK